MQRVRNVAGLLAGLWAVALAAAPAGAGLVNFWTFDGDMADTAGACPGNTSASATDMEEYQADGTSHPTYVPGRVAGTLALQTVAGSHGAVVITRAAFDGTADVALAPNSTLAFWVKLPATTAEFFTDGNRMDHLKIISWGSGSVDVQVSGVAGDTTPLNITVPPAQWCFLTITADDERDLRCVYVNGVRKVSGVYLEHGTPVPKYLCLGVPDKVTYWGAVAFSRMSVWNHTLSDSEVMDLYLDEGDIRQHLKAPVLIVR